MDSTSISLERSKSENDIFVADSDSLDSQSENKIPKENWKGRVRSSPAMRRSKISILNPHDVTYKYNTVPLLQNGYTASRRIKKKSLLCPTHVPSIAL